MVHYLYLVSQFLKIKAHIGPLIKKVDIENNNYLWYSRNQQALINLNKLITKVYLGILLIKHLTKKNKRILFVTNKTEHFLFKNCFKSKRHSFFYGSWVSGSGFDSFLKIPKKPDLVFILDAKHFQNLARECSFYDIPVFSVLNLEQKNKHYSYVIPGNTDNFFFIWFLLYLFYLESF